MAATKKSTTHSSEKKKLTLGDLTKKLSGISASQVGYVLLLIAFFAIGYLVARVQHLESAKTATTTTTQPAAQAAPKISLDKVKEVFKNSKVKFGDTNKKLVVLEVADPSCPYCHVAGGKNPELNKQVGQQFVMTADGGTYVAPVPEIKKLVDDGKASFAYIYYPGHGNGEMGMKAMYCANEKGDFWAVSDLLMSAQGYTLLNDTVKNDPAQSQTIVDFLSGATDATALKSCIDSGKYDEQLKKDTAVATEIGVQGTPGFYLNDTLFSGAYSFKDMEQAVKDAGI